MNRRLFFGSLVFFMASALFAAWAAVLTVRLPHFASTGRWDVVTMDVVALAIWSNVMLLAWLKAKLLRPEAAKEIA